MVSSILTIWLTVLLSSVAFASYAPSRSLTLDPPNSTDHHPHKRWLGVQPIEDGKAWGYYGPWPEACEGSTPVRYCFSDARSLKNLEKVLDAAIAGWSHAFLVSTMSIIPDQPNGLLCDDPSNNPKVRDDALVILDATRDGDDDFNWNKCNTESETTGYDYYHKEKRGRHKITFCHLIPGEEQKTEAKAIKAMMHELGHVQGLNQFSGHALMPSNQSEHQRVDRDTFIDFHCDRLDGYKKAIDAVDFDAEAIFGSDPDSDTSSNDTPKTSHEDRVKSLCTQDRAAAAYLPAALAFMTEKSHVDRKSQAHKKWKYYAYSKTFDHESVMIYDSYSGSPPGTDLTDKSKWVIARKDGSAILQGGSADPAKAKISEGDVARVAQLYPKADDASKAAAKLDRWAPARGKKLRVKIRGYESIVEAPTKLEEAQEVPGVI